MNQTAFVRLMIMVVIPLLTLFLGINIGSSQLGKAGNSLSGSTQTTTGALLDQLSLTEPNIGKPGDFEESFYTFWEVYRRLKKFHPDGENFTEKDFLYGAVKGLAGSLEDPYTYFLTPDETNEFVNVDLNGELQGIGAELRETQSGAVEIAAVLPNAPAEKAGLIAGDLILKVNGEDMLGKTVYEIVKVVRGPKGTKVVLTIGREGEDAPVDFTIERADIKVPSVEYKTLMNGSVGYIELHKFSESTVEEIQSVANTILLSPPQALVLDLRDNAGGYLEASVDVVSLFLEKSKVVTVRNMKATEPTEYMTKGNARLAKFPLVVLINGQSASAAEIVAGALQDMDRGLLIGEHSYGKGSVQELSNLPDGSSLRLTIAKWYTPTGRNVEEKIGEQVGIIPDEIVPRTIDDRKNGKDPQLDRALEAIAQGKVAQQ